MKAGGANKYSMWHKCKWDNWRDDSDDPDDGLILPSTDDSMHRKSCGAVGWRPQSDFNFDFDFDFDFDTNDDGPPEVQSGTANLEQQLKLIISTTIASYRVVRRPVLEVK